jgi:hypothetical protein
MPDTDAARVAQIRARTVAARLAVNLILGTPQRDAQLLQCLDDLDVVLAALTAAEQERDAQAARLAAVEQAIADNQWMHESHGVTRANDLRPRGYCTGCGDKHPCDPISLLEDLEAALKGAPDA